VSGRDIPPDAGRAPPFDPLETPGPEDTGAGAGYSGQEYDNAGQRQWRADQDDEVAPDGEVRGSGVSAGGGNMKEEYDGDVATGGGERPPEGD
jgi:hypothetical protein